MVYGTYIVDSKCARVVSRLQSATEHGAVWDSLSQRFLPRK